MQERGIHMKERIFSGVQPSGIPTLGNYIGAMKSFVDLQDQYDAIYCVVNQHAITVNQDPETLRQRTKQLAALYLAIGIDPQKATIFVQSDVPAHTKASWLVTCLTGLGELERMTQFKDKAQKQQSVGAGLLCYPALMVSDIILYQAKYVPVGDDQRQHLELTRNFVDRFNNRFGENCLVKPEGVYPKAGSRVMSLQDPSSKMSKSDSNPKGYISLLDDPKQMIKKIKSAVTDSLGQVKYDPENQAGLANLMAIYSSLSGQSLESIEANYQGKGYGPFKQDLADLLVATLQPIQERYQALMTSDELLDILSQGAIKANELANQTLAIMEDKMGIAYR